MLKVMGLIRRRPDLPLDGFRLHWRTIHRGLALRLAEAGFMRGYVQNHRIDIPAPGLRVIADGVPELWFTDVEAFAGMRSSPALREGAYQDEPEFMDITDYRSQLLEEEMGVGAGRQECVGLLKAMLFLRDGEGGLPVGGAVRSARQEARQLDLPIRLAGYAAVETSWWPDFASFERAWGEQRLVDGLIAEERVVFWPGDPAPPADWRPIAQTRA